MRSRYYQQRELTAIGPLWEDADGCLRCPCAHQEGIRYGNVEEREHTGVLKCTTCGRIYDSNGSPLDG